MKNATIPFLITMSVALLTGCAKQEPDCNNPRDKQEQQDCAHKASTSSGAIPDTLPTNNKKW